LLNSSWAKKSQDRKLLCLISSSWEFGAMTSGSDHLASISKAAFLLTQLLLERPCQL
jgi:hypothetical protein